MPKYGTRTIRLAAAAALLAAAAAPSGRALAADKTVVSVAYGSTYVFDTDDLAKKWWNGVKAQFEKAHPDATVQLVPIAGGYDDIINKLSLLYRSAKTAPDVAQVPTPVIGEWVASEYLLPMDDYLKGSDWWATFPQVIKDEGTFSGKVYAVSGGENDSQLYYNKDLFKKAGLPVPWQPKNWDDILTAARQIKQKLPGVVPIWLNAGTSSGTNGILQGAGNMLYGSVDPTIFDAKTQKWVVDSSGLREVLGFYKAVYGEGMGGALSDLFSPSAVTVPINIMPTGKMAIVFGSNYYGGQWTKPICAPCWLQAPEVEGVLPIPYSHGQGPNIATTVGGWDFTISATTKNPKLAWELVDLMENEQNTIDAANWAGWVPASQKFAMAPALLDFAPPFNKVASQVLPYGKITPPMADFEVWSHGLQAATGALAQHPETTVDQAVAVMKDYVTNQLGDDKVETLK